MARCPGDPPCKFVDDVHDHGCAQRGKGFANRELAELYATETPDERARLDVVLELALTRAGLDVNEVEADEVAAGEKEWVVLRRALRDGGAAADLSAIASLFRAVPDGDGDVLLHLA